MIRTKKRRRRGLKERNTEFVGDVSTRKSLCHEMERTDHARMTFSRTQTETSEMKSILHRKTLESVTLHAILVDLGARLYLCVINMRGSSVGEVC